MGAPKPDTSAQQAAIRKQNALIAKQIEQANKDKEEAEQKINSLRQARRGRVLGRNLLSESNELGSTLGFRENL